MRFKSATLLPYLPQLPPFDGVPCPFDRVDVLRCERGAGPRIGVRGRLPWVSGLVCTWVLDGRVAWRRWGVSRTAYAPATGFRRRSSGNREKSLSRVRSSSAAWATQIAAIRASWTTPPVTPWALYESPEYREEIARLANQPTRGRPCPLRKLLPCTLLRGDGIAPDLPVGHHAKELVTARPRNRPCVVTLGQIPQKDAATS